MPKYGTEPFKKTLVFLLFILQFLHECATESEDVHLKLDYLNEMSRRQELCDSLVNELTKDELRQQRTLRPNPQFSLFLRYCGNILDTTA